MSYLLQPAQAEVVLGQLSTYLASWEIPMFLGIYLKINIRGKYEVKVIRCRNP
jgi:hypothetical protein